MLQGVLSPSMMRLLEIAMQVSDESVEHMTRLVPLAEALGAAVGLPEEMGSLPPFKPLLFTTWAVLLCQGRYGPSGTP